jgi:hypothetical protein
MVAGSPSPPRGTRAELVFFFHSGTPVKGDSPCHRLFEGDMSYTLDCALVYAPGHILQIDLVQERILPRRQGRTVDVIDLLVRNMEPNKPVQVLYLLYPNTLPDQSFLSREYLKTPVTAEQKERIKDFVKLQHRARHYPAGQRPWWPCSLVWQFGIIDRTIDLTKPDWIDNTIYHEAYGAEFQLNEIPEQSPNPKGWRMEGWFYLQPETVDQDLAQNSELFSGIDLQKSRINFSGQVRPFEQYVGVADELSDEECQLLSDTGFSLIKVAFTPGAEITTEPRWLRLELWPTRCNYMSGDSGWWSGMMKRLTFQDFLIECSCVGGRGVKIDFKCKLDIIRRQAEQKNNQFTIRLVQDLHRKIIEGGLLASSTGSEVRHCMISFQRKWRVGLSDATSYNSIKLNLPRPLLGAPACDTLARFLTGFAYYSRSHPILLAQSIQQRLGRYFSKPDQAKTTQEIAKELEVNTAFCGAVLQWMIQNNQIKQAAPDKFFWDANVASFLALRGLYSVVLNGQNADVYRELNEARPCSLDFRAHVKLRKSNILTPIAIWLGVLGSLPPILDWIWKLLGLEK